jgi:hypothetical protein
MALVPVTIVVKVEEHAFVPVVRALRHTHGVVGLDFDLETGAKAKSLNGAPQRPGSQKPVKGALQELMLQLLFNEQGALSAKKIQEAAIKAGFKASSVDQGLYHFFKNGVVERTGPGWYKLSPKARQQMTGVAAALPAPEAASAAPPPAKGKQGIKALPALLAIFAAYPGHVARDTLQRELAVAGLAVRTLDKNLQKAHGEGLIKSIGNGVYELTPKGRKTAAKHSEE